MSHQPQGSTQQRKGLRVKSIVLDGFKSYAHRQQLAELDGHFNAITGQNGSGKSNIFDALCFVMGIANVKRMRANDKRELIFKNGNAGVQSAHVVIEFTNDDPETAPVGYTPSDFPIITVGRKIFSNGTERYFVNERVADQAFVKRFFHSIHLNVDNPHFMVLQGQVHKLVDMKPSDILGLLEEAAGTRVFDTRRRTAENLIRQKDKRIEDLNRNIAQEIAPRLESRLMEQQQYNEFQRKMEQLEERKKFKIAFGYWSDKQTFDKDSVKLQELVNDVERAKGLVKSLPEDIAQAKKAKERLEADHALPVELVAKLQHEASEAKKMMAKSEAEMANGAKKLKAFEREAKQIEKEEQLLVKKTQQFSGVHAQRQELITKLTKVETAVENLKESLRLQKAGVAVGMNGMSVTADQTVVERELVKTKAEINRVREDRANLLREAERLVAEETRSKSETAAFTKALESASQRVKAAREKYAPYAPLEEAAAKTKAAYDEKFAAVQNAAAECGSQVNIIEYDHEACPGVEQHILGRLGELVQCVDSKYSKALSIGAMQNLWRVVVTDDQVAESILIRGRLRARTSFFPLNKIKGNSNALDSSKLAAAKAIARQCGGEVFVAKDLIKYDAQLTEVVSATFGNWVVCSNLQLAKELAFDSRTKIRAVSLEGDVADPKGTMQGGSAREVRDTLRELNAIAARRAPLAALRRERDNLQAEMNQLRTKLGQGAALKRQLEDAEDAFVAAQQRANGGAGSRNIQSELEANESMQKANATKEEGLEATKTSLLDRQAKLLQLAADDPAKVEKELNAKLKEAVQEVKALKIELDAGTQQHDATEAEIEQRTTELANKKKELVDDETAQRRELDEAGARLVTLTADVQQYTTRIADAEAEIAELDKQLEANAQGLKKLTDALTEAESKVKTSDTAKKQLKLALDELSRRMREAERSHAYLLRDAHEFGNPAGRYFFEDEQRTSAELHDIDEHERLKLQMAKRFNKATLVGQEDVKKDYDRVLCERDMLVEDKESIRSAITTIEEKKWATLDVKSKQVSQVFSQLFGMCLPGATASLREERDSSGHITGLEVKVAFNNKEKESLTELSGGQRSLLALCLILAILRLNPAPIYILDEVDAALDPSHTQNIGAMLQKYFSDAQFLLISLKDGMFNNANVLYEIRNTQGFSEISRRQARK